MITEHHFYHATTKKCIAVFGSCFNNVKIARTSADGTTLSDYERVPLAYGAKQKFLSRITEQTDLTTDKIALKLPRMAFEITTISNDAGIRLNKLNQPVLPIVGDNLHGSTAYQSSPWVLGIQLNILARNQDDALQCLEQILPTFNPEYTVSVKDLEMPGTTTDIPIILNAITLADSYDGDISAPRTIVYSLDFSLKVKYTGPVKTNGIIRFVEAGFHTSLDQNSKAEEFAKVSVGANDTPTNFTATISIGDTHGF